MKRIAAYRIQFRGGMTFERAAEAVPYLKRLGISHLYASPVFTATNGSTHGYDVTDCNSFDPAIGGEADFEALHRTLRDADMGLILDIVPNHMAASLENRWWRSVIEFGQASPYAAHFDIDWSRRLTLPILGQDFPDALAAGEFSLAKEEGRPVLCYFDQRLPLCPQSMRLVSGISESDLAKLSRDKAFLARLHDAQPWRLSSWRDARRDLSYRRFFEVTGLVGMRVEQDHVFDDMHRLVLHLVHTGMVQGLRVDHVDGLAHPSRYLRRLRQEVGPQCWIIVEKILGEGEWLPQDWHDVGSTGYEFIPALAQLFVTHEGFSGMAKAYADFTGKEADRLRELRAARVQILTHNFEGELGVLSKLAASLRPDMDASAVADAVREIILGFPVYRTYGDQGVVSGQDRAVIQHAAGQARDHAEPEAVEFIAELLEGKAPEAERDAGKEFRIRFQQLTGPVMAKSVEDTFFYRMNEMIGLNEVGCHPLPHFGGVEGFHDEMRAFSRRAPSLLATSTHDTKFGEDSRALLLALAERPEEWAQCFRRWQEMNPPHGDLPDPEVEWQLYQALAAIWPHDASWQDPRNLGQLEARFLAYIEKALREAKRRTSWLDVDVAYEAAICDHVRRWFGDAEFLTDFSARLKPWQEASTILSLSQTLAKLTAPGIPDMYQGAEGLALSLVDPDNRRPVDFESLSRALDAASFNKQEMIARILALRAKHLQLFLTGLYLPLAVEGEGAVHYPAFLREDGDAAAIVVLQRLPMRNPGPERTHLRLPDRLTGRRFRLALSHGEIFAASHSPLAELLGGLPVSLAISASA